jgi:hypothetical protein
MSSHHRIKTFRWFGHPDSTSSHLEFAALYRRAELVGSHLCKERKDGPAANSKHKHAIRRYFHKQLLRLWQTKEPLVSRAAFHYHSEDHTSGHISIDKTGIELIADSHCLGNQKFVPIVRREWALTCALEILILRPDHFPVITSGDLDKRVKTLLDALRIPQVGEHCEGEENPLFCLLENDNLVSEIRVTADLLMCPPEQIVNDPKTNVFGDTTVRDTHALALIHVLVKPTCVMNGNLDFV